MGVLRSEVQVTDKNGNQAVVDKYSNAMVVAPVEHHFINMSQLFYVVDFQEGLGSGDIIKLLLTSPDTNTRVFINLSASSTAGMKLEIFEGTDYSGGTILTPRNYNRDNPVAPVSVVVKDPTIDSVGTKAMGFKAGTNKLAGTSGFNEGHLLAQNTTYLMRMTSTDTGNDISYHVSWAEE